MGKKSKNPRKPNNCAVPSTRAQPSAAGEACHTTEATSYPSDGPSMEELECLQTTSSSLQAKLDQLTTLAIANDRAGFVQEFVPLDLSAADTTAYLQDLTTAPEADSQWANLAAEISALAAGKGVKQLQGDQQTRTVFFFEHPLLPGCDREVTFVCCEGKDEWRAEG